MSDKYCILQDDLKDCGVSCLLSVIKYYGGDVTREYLKEMTNTTKSFGVNALNLIRTARNLGFESYGLKGKINTLKLNYLPVIAHVILENKFGHFMVIYQIDLKKDKILVMDPSRGYVSYSKSQFEKISSGNFLFLKPKTVIPKLVEEKSGLNILKNTITKYKSLFIIVFLLSFLYTLLNIVSSYHFKILYDESNSMQTIDLKNIFYFLSCLLIFKGIINLLRNHLINSFNFILDKTLVKDAYRHIIYLPFLYYKNHTNGDLFTRINDLGNVKELISNFFISIFVDLVLALFIFIMLLKINVSLSLIILGSLLIYSFVIIIYNANMQRIIKNVYASSSKVNNYLVESLASFETIKNLSIEEYVCKKFNYEYGEYNAKNQVLLQKINTQAMFKNIILTLSNLLLIYFGIIKVQNNFLSITSLITLITLANYLIEPVKNILDLQLVYLNTKESIRRIKEIYAIPKEKVSYNPKSNIKTLLGRIDMDNVSYSYDGIVKVLDNTSLEIKEGSKVVIYGKSGCGKSTLMQLLTKYLNNDYAGNITIDGFDLKDIDLYTLRKNICYVSQNEFIFSDSVYENITLGRKILYKDFLQIAKNLFIDEIVRNSTLSYNYVLENNGENISGGEKARILLARSLLQKANVFIYDETFSNIDIDKERRILEYLFTKYQDKTFIIISHRISNEDLFDKKIMFGEDNE